MEEQRFFINDKDTTDIIIELGKYKNDIVTISNKIIMEIAQELHKDGNVSMKFVKGMGVVPVLSQEEEDALTEQAKVERDERFAGIVEEAEDWADKGEREMSEREIVEELKRDEQM